MKLFNSAVSIKDENGLIEIIAPAKSNFFIDILSKRKEFSAPIYYQDYTGDFILRCKVNPFFTDTYDAGGLVVFESPVKWIKLAFEKTDIGYESVVNVVTNKVSDDSNGERVNNDSIWLQVVRRGSNWVTHYSIDGKEWRMVRYFYLSLRKKLRIGLFSQSPLGKGCKSIFNNFEVLPNTYDDIRKTK